MTSTETTNLEQVVQSANEAYAFFRTTNVAERAELMRAIAQEIENLGSELIETAQAESNLPEARLRGEKGRTVNQWRVYAAAIETGSVLDLRIDIPGKEDSLANVDIRKTQVPLGPVAIFGASNFPFAFSTAGGDTASAIAAGNPVVVKGHPGHPKTAKMMGEAIKAAIAKKGYPKGIFDQVFGGLEIGKELVLHPAIKAVGFTGSFGGGKALYDLASNREEPIPVFSEMGSINPMFLLPEKLKNADPDLAQQYVGSLTLGTGQFCTNPGVLVTLKGPGFDEFIDQAKQEIQKKGAERMLHSGISKSYLEKSGKMVEHPAVNVIAYGDHGEADSGQAVLAVTSGKDFLRNEEFCGEVFGPFGLIVVCDSYEEMEKIAGNLEGQLTTTVLAEENELKDYGKLIDLLREKCGRIIFNNFPTGVAVCYGMQHGGPFPSTTDSRFTSVGPDAIKRFLRPVTYQNWPESLLPDELKNENPLKLYRTVNGKIVTEQI